MIKSLFPDSMLNTQEMSLETIAGKFDYFFRQIHLIHLQTSSYAEHLALNIWEDMPDSKDSFIEKLSGYTGRKLRAYKTQDIVDNALSTVVVGELKNFARELKLYGEANGYSDIVNMSDELSGKAAKVLYLLTLS
jgi:hypothetical protein